ncbi:hypothetical protein ACHHYP_02488 [Achlya hypogyna]|uniref:Uncharacterized protein n=1 Tax=Achlya hypogyna TaxID=1202772 RepID=A0A1V9Z683_ACHHY|nr:hypothetical protein ACHHYP_02488 [Achlya hypogyna]
MWAAYVVAGELAVSLVGSIAWIRRATPGAEYTALHLTPRPPRGWFWRGYHVVCLLFFFSVLVAELVQTRGRSLGFYTCWNFALQTTYWAWAICDVSRTSRGRRLLLDVAFPNSLLVLTVVWLILYPRAQAGGWADKFLNELSYIQHGGNVVFLAVEFAADPIPMANGGAALQALFSTTYAIVAWIVHAVTGFWPYPFLKIETPSAPLWYAFLLALHFAFFLLVKCIAGATARRKAKSRTESLDAAAASLLGHDSAGPPV